MGSDLLELGYVWHFLPSCRWTVHALHSAGAQRLQVCSPAVQHQPKCDRKTLPPQLQCWQLGVLKQFLRHTCLWVDAVSIIWFYVAHKWLFWREYCLNRSPQWCKKDASSGLQCRLYKASICLNSFQNTDGNKMKLLLKWNGSS